jgi:alpha-tubulin suppressor-like RCC1 family protein
MTFGAAHHAALGVSDTTKNAHHTNRPRRVTLDEHRRRTNPAVQVAAAAHHTLVLTKQGHVFACGLGKGGRLGTSGQEQSTPIPLRVRGSLAKRHVIFIAAAENHSLCVTKEGGHVFSWGSNRFGQLDGCCSSNGGGSSSGSNANNSSSSFRCLPHRVVDLKKPCVAVAAGERHSVALTSHGEVITWGDNAAGQLGRNNYNRKNGIDRVDALWSCERVAIQVAASAQSTLILIAPSPRKGLPVNQVYSWGHGNAVPIKVTFQVPNETKSSLGTSNDNKSYHHRHQSLQQVNPIDIACAKHHNVAATEDGKVFTWGLHAEPLASKQSSSSLVVASPVTAMLPENGGGLAVAVSASDQVTAVVTSEGHLYSWGCTNGKDVMGHEGLRWQPSPKRVPSVHRAVGLAIAKEHTVLLIGASYPAVPPPVFESNLESLAAREVCHHVDMFNVIPVCIMAERSQSRLLQDYCREFIRENLDVVLTFGRKSEMDVYLDEQLADSRVKLSRDAAVHPLVTEVVMAGKSSQEWLRSCQAIVDHLPISTLVRYQRRQKRRVSSFHESHFDHEDHQPQQKALQTGLHGCSERCLMLTANIGSLQTETDIKAKFECLSKEMRGIRKRLAQTNKLQLKETLTSDEREKLNRKPLLEADLAQLSPAMQKVEKLMSERNLDLVKIHAALPVDKNTKDVSPKDTSEAVAYLCAVCDISCPDANHLELHKSGRKHRNRMKQVEEEEEEKTAAFIAAQNQQQAFLAGATPPPAAMSKSISPWSTDTIQPRYQLTPPIAPPASKVVADKKTARLASHPVGDFRSILAEQGDGKPIGRKVPTSFKDQQKQTRTPKVPPNKSLLTPGPVAPLQNAPWAKSSVIQVSVAAKSPSKESVTVGNKRPLSSGKKQSLGSFLSDPSPSKASSPAAASWCASPVTKKVVPALPSPSLNSKSLLEIQQEEEAFVRRQAQHAAKEGKWYLERVDRANSLSAIQEAETEEQEMLILIEEQKQIEAQIARDHNQQKDSKKKNASIKKTKKRNCARNRSASHPQGNTKQKDAQYDTSKKGDDSAPSVTKQQQLPHQASRNHNAKKQGSKSQQHSSKQRNQKNVKKGTTNARKRAESHPAAATTITSPQK